MVSSHQNIFQRFPISKGMVAAGIVLVGLSAVSARYPSESEFSLSPGFIRKAETGLITYDVKNREADRRCDTDIFRSQTANHKVAVMSPFKNSSISVRVTIKGSNNISDPAIIVKSVINNNPVYICSKNDEGVGSPYDEEIELSYYSYEDSLIVPEAVYEVWVGDRREHSRPTRYSIEVEEEDHGFML